MHHIIALLLVGITVLMAGDPPPTVNVAAYRDPIQGRTVYAFAFSCTTVPSAAITLTCTFEGTAQSNTDYTPISTTVTIPAGLATNRSRVIAVTALASANGVGRTIRCRIQPNAAYVIGTNATAMVAIRPAFSNSDLTILGEPALVTPTAGTGWTYQLSINRPSQLPADAFELFLDPAPGFVGQSLPTFLYTPFSSASSTSPMTTAVSTTVGAADQQIRFRLSVLIDIDGLPANDPDDGDPNERNDDVMIFQDVVLAPVVGSNS